MLYLIYSSSVFGLGNAPNSLASHNGERFSTKDQDNDQSDLNCAADEDGKGAWWYRDCRESNLNGVYPNEEDQGTLLWSNIHPIKRAEMKIRPTDLFKPMD